MKNIILAEDELSLARPLQLKLEQAGYQVFHANDGVEALRLFKEKEPNLMLLDLVMPELNGFQVLEEIQKTPNKVPLVVLSNLGQKQDIERAEKLGVKKFLVKSNTSLAEIVKEVESLLPK